MLRCKFKVDGVETPEYDKEQRILTLSACVDESGDNKDWSKWTPSGSFQICVTNTNLIPKIDAMKPGDVHYIDLSEAI